MQSVYISGLFNLFRDSHHEFNHMEVDKRDTK